MPARPPYLLAILECRFPSDTPCTPHFSAAGALSTPNTTNNPGLKREESTGPSDIGQQPFDHEHILRRHSPCRVIRVVSGGISESCHHATRTASRQSRVSRMSTTDSNCQCGTSKPSLRQPLVKCRRTWYCSSHAPQVRDLGVFWGELCLREASPNLSSVKLSFGTT